ncbi:MAG: response regulator [Planctomycetales bacterium]|nr:response regulator [Planctomycetales bacterium]
MKPSEFNLFVFVTLVFLSEVVFGQTVAEPIGRIETVKEMTRAEADAKHRCELEATVYCFNPQSHSFFAGQGRDMIVVTNAGEFLPPGTLVKIRGTTGTDPHQVGNVIYLQDLERIPPALGQGSMVAPVEVDIEKIKFGDIAGWVTAEVDVHSIVTDGKSFSLYTSLGGVSTTVTCPAHRDVSELAALVGAKLRITGNLSHQVTENAPVVYSIACPEEFLQVATKPSVALEPIPGQSVSEIWEKDVSQFRVKGQVTFVTPDWFYVQNGSDGVFLLNREHLPVSTGDIVDVFGLKEPLPSGGAFLIAKLISIVGSAPLQDVPLADVKQISAENSECIRVKVSGDYLHHETSGFPDKIFLSADGRTFEVHIWDQSIEPLDLKTAKTIEATGTCSIYGATDSEFIIHAPTLDDIRVVDRVSFWSPATVGVVTTIVIVALMGLLRLRSLHSKLRQNRDSVVNLNAQLQLVSKTVRDGILIAGKDDRIVHRNERAIEILSFPIEVGDDVREVQRQISSRLAGDSADLTWDELNHSPTETMETSLRLRTTEAEHLKVLGIFTAPIIDAQQQFLGRLWAIYDLSERQNLLDSLAEASRQTAVGRLAGGFAHDFNNLLSAIQNSLYVAKEGGLLAVDRTNEMLEIALDATDRAAELVTQLLSYSRRTLLNRHAQDINDLVVRVTHLVKPMMRNKGTLSTELTGGLPHVNVDEARLQQVILNLCLNAIDAVEEGGEITVSTRLEHRAGTDSEIVVSVRDTGCGMKHETLKYVFEPFFTTKQEKGTGLGLAMAQGIVEQHGGRITCESELGVGSEFRIYLPALKDKTAVRAQVDLQNADPTINDRCFLLVDDEPIVLKSIQILLELQGATVFSASSGEQALELLEKHHSIDIVLLDWSMPGMHGRDVLREIKQSYPGLTTIICTGCVSDVESTEYATGMAPDGVLQKPYNHKQISDLLKEQMRSVGRQFSKSHPR